MGDPLNDPSTSPWTSRGEPRPFDPRGHGAAVPVGPGAGPPADGSEAWTAGDPVALPGGSTARRSGCGCLVVVLALAVLGVAGLVAFLVAGPTEVGGTGGAGGQLLAEADGTVEEDGTARIEFAVSARGAVQVDVRGRDGFDPVARLRTASGALVAEDDDGGRGLDSRIREVLDPGGYILEVRGFAGRGGSFEVEITRR